jgi:hypothetical protein
MARSAPHQRGDRLVVAVCVGLALALLAFYVSIYPIKGHRVALGSDTPVYVFWSRYAGTAGLGALGIGRPATVGTLATLARLLGQPGSAVAASVAPVMAVAIALALGALVDFALGRDRLRFILAVALTGTFLSLLVGGYLSTLAFGTAFVGMLALAAVGLGRADRRTVVGAAILLGAAGLAHPVFLALAGVVIGGGLLALVPATRRQLAEGNALSSTGAGRVLAASVGGVAVTAAGVGATAFASTDGPRLAVDTSRDAVLRRTGLGGAFTETYRRKLLHDFPWYRAVVTIAAPLTALFARRAQRDGSAFFWGTMIAWAGVTVVAVLALLVGIRVPGQRLAIFCLAIPALAAVGLRRIGRPLLAGGAAVFVLVAWLGWWSQRPVVTPEVLIQANVAGGALAVTPAGTPLVLVGDIRAQKPGFLVVRFASYLRGAVPSARVPDVHVFVGSVEDFLARRPTLTGNREHDLLAGSYWAEIEPILDQDPVVVVLESFDRATFEAALDLSGSTPIGPGVVALPGFSAVPDTGTETAAALREPGEAPMSPWTPVWLAPLLLVIVTALGWPLVLLALRQSEIVTRLALSPAFGIAALGLASVAVDAVGMRLSDAGGYIAVGLTVVAGLLAVALDRRAAGGLSPGARPEAPEPRPLDLEPR